MSANTETPGLAGPARAYIYLVALVAIHMVVLGTANLIRVGAEILLQAPSRGFEGLPFVFVDYNQPSLVYRSQFSLALALAMVGGVGWVVHWGIATRVVRRVPAERRAGVRSFYLNLVDLVTALLCLGFGVAFLSGLINGLLGQPFFGKSNGVAQIAWNPRFDGPYLAQMVGQMSMVLVAGAVLTYHLLAGRADRRIVAVGGMAATLRRLRVYLLSGTGLALFTINLAGILGSIWRYRFPEARSTYELAGALVFSLAFVPPGLALWLGSWLPAQGLVGGVGLEADGERESLIRRLLLYSVVLISGAAALIALAIMVSDLVRRLLGDNSGAPALHAAGRPLATILVFGAFWWLYRRAIENDATLQRSAERGATLRLLYYYAICAISMTIVAVGAAGLVGVIGSRFVTGHDNHPPSETALYITLLLVGIPTWSLHWLAVVRRIAAGGDAAAAERRALVRRAYLYLAAFGGIATLLVAGSAVAFRFLNGLLLGSLAVSEWHTIWHLSVDAAVGLAVFVFHFAIVRADRAATASLAVPEAQEREHRIMVVVRAASPELAQAMLADALRSSVRMRVEGAVAEPSRETQATTVASAQPGSLC